MKILVITGNEIRHNYLLNRIANLNGIELVALCHFSGKSDFEYYYPIYSRNCENQEDKEKIIQFIFSRNSSFAIREDYNLLKSYSNRIVTTRQEDFQLALDDVLKKHAFDFVICFGAPIIKNPQLLKGNQNVYNIHLGLSRFYRGGTTNLQALARGEFDKVGSTCHELMEEIDAGKILFEINEIPYREIENFDLLSYYIIKSTVNELIDRIIGKKDLSLYTTNLGEMILNKTLTSDIVLKAEENLKKKFKELN